MQVSTIPPNNPAPDTDDGDKADTDRTPPQRESDRDRRETTFSVEGMDCASCADKIGAALDNVDGLIEREMLPATGKVTIAYNPTTVSREELIETIASTGYDVTDPGDTEATSDETSIGAREPVWRSDRAVKTGVAGFFLAAGLIPSFFDLDPQMFTLLGISFHLSAVLFLAGIATGAPIILRNGYRSGINQNLDIDFLMSTAIISALIASLGFGAELYFEAATLVVLFNVAELLERHSMDRARNSLRELMDLSPDTATVRRDGDEIQIPVEEVKIGDTVIVRPGEKIPMDGTVTDGESAVNQAPVTGESIPVDKTPGDDVYAGTVNEEGYLEVEATTDASNNTLSKIINLVEKAESSKTQREQFVERFSTYYTPAMVVLAVLTAAVPPLLFGLSWTTWFLAGITMLVLACPCAFIISTPVTVVSGITSAAKNGVLIKGGTHLEATGEIEAVAFDKTGTLTRGELTVTDIIPLNGYSENDVLRCAQGLEARSEHPVGEAITEEAQERDVDHDEVGAFESITGKGVKADLSGEGHYAGKPGLFEELGFDLTHVHTAMESGELTSKSRSMCERNDCIDILNERIPELQAEGKTVIVVGNEDEVEGLIAVADEVRHDASRTIEQLHSQGITTVMLTGDNKRTAKAIAEQVGIDDHHAELLPEAKVEKVKDLVGTYDGVAMVGDGVNDAPALATATVGVAMGAAGTDTAIETADIALMGDDLSRVPYLYKLSHTANNVIRQNIYSSLGIKLLLAIGVPLQLVSVALAVLLGDAGMTVGVTGNAMRLSRINPDDFKNEGETGA